MVKKKLSRRVMNYILFIITTIIKKVSITNLFTFC